MIQETPVDRFNRPAALGNHNGRAIPIKVDEYGRVYIANMGGGNLNAAIRYELVKVLQLDLSVERINELIDISFDSFAAADLKGSFFMGIGSDADEYKITVCQRMSMSVTADKAYISNTAQEECRAVLWFFKIKDTI